MTSKSLGFKTLASIAVAVALLAGVAGPAQAAATIVINNINGAGVGFNDPTPAAPVGGNPATTLGQQRLFAFTYAANIWGATLTSPIPIIINAQMTPLACTATGATLGSAGATSAFANFPSAPKANTLYGYALANKLAGAYQGTLNAAQISANFNSNLGNPGCLTGTFFYLGIDNNHGANIDFVTVLLHEMGHGVGFQTFTNGSTGAFNGGLPSIWDHYLLDTSTGLVWKDMTAAQRAASALSVNGLVWSGPLVTAVLPSVLTLGNPSVTISGPAAGAAAGVYPAGLASFGAVVTSVPLTAQVMPVLNADNTRSPACDPFTANQATAVNGRIAIIDRGVCTFAVKAKNAQNAGAIGVIIHNNVAGAAPGLGGTDPTVVIRTVSVSLADGNTIRSSLNRISRTGSGVIGTIGFSGSQYAGADPIGRALMYAPNPFVSGSSVSHFDISMFRNQLMEPAINGDLTHSVVPPEDMTFPLLQDTGW
jgi:hypothetical protein